MALTVLALATLLGACGLAGDLTGQLSVKVVNAATGDGLPLTTSFEACPVVGPCITAPAVPQLGGIYTITLPIGSYQLTASRSGYLPATTRNVVVSSDTTRHLERIALVPTERDEPAPASGRIRDALTGSGLPNASVRLRQGMDTRTGSIVATAATDVLGDYAFTSVPAGIYTAQVSATGYATGYFTLRVVGSQANATQDAAVPPDGVASVYRIVLTWDAAPADLDAHLTGPAEGGTRYHVYAAQPTFVIGTTMYAQIELDATAGFGPETISLFERLTGVHRFSVHDATNRLEDSSTALANSGARVDVYRGANLEATFHVPVGTGTLWTVFELDGTVITPVGEVSYQPDGASVTSVRD